MFRIWTTPWNLMTAHRLQTEAARKTHWYILNFPTFLSKHSTKRRQTATMRLWNGVLFVSWDSLFSSTLGSGLMWKSFHGTTGSGNDSWAPTFSTEDTKTQISSQRHIRASEVRYGDHGPALFSVFTFHCFSSRIVDGCESVQLRVCDAHNARFNACNSTACPGVNDMV